MDFKSLKADADAAALDADARGVPASQVYDSIKLYEEYVESDAYPCS